MPTDTRKCLNSGRFKVEVKWKDFGGVTGSGQVVPFGSLDSGLFYFFSAGNWEMLVKVLDGCGINTRFWVYAAATTNVEYTLFVTDTHTGRTRSYYNPLGSNSQRSPTATPSTPAPSRSTAARPRPASCRSCSRRRLQARARRSSPEGGRSRPATTTGHLDSASKAGASRSR